MPSGSHPYRHRGGDRLRMAGATAVAVLAVLAGILLVNLFNGPPGSDDDATAGAAPTRMNTADPDGSRPTVSAEPTPSRRPTPTSVPAAASTPPPAAQPSPSPQSAPALTAEPPGAAPRVVAPVVVLNNSRIAGLADSAADRVEAAGFEVERVGNYLSRYNVPVSTVFYDPEDADAARTLLETVPGVERMVPRAETRIVETDTLILVITRDFPVDGQP